MLGFWGDALAAGMLAGVRDPRRDCAVQKSRKEMPGTGAAGRALYLKAENKLDAAEGFSLRGFAKAAALGGLMEGLGSAAFYGVGKGLESLWGECEGEQEVK